MFSIENPPEPDPPCSSSQPYSRSDERVSQLPTSSAHNKLPPSNLSEVVVVVDLPNPNPCLDNLTPPPNFSIRDYVFKARSKGIKNSWPFSQKNLQHCLRHGVKDVLPQFEPLDTLRNQSFKRLKGETSSVEKQSISKRRYLDEEASRPGSHVVEDLSDDAQLHTKLAESCVDISSCRYGEENDFPSTATSEIDSVPDRRKPRSPLETQTLSKAAAEAGAPMTHKTESTTRPLANKKCRLIVKFGGNSDRTSAEDIASNCTTISETMASKLCPVCKTFSSSSNTTLNAHIDQCLSMESTPKWTADSKLNRYRVKPRKTRLMVDIYTTAQYCTLEELDRRNGTSWATMSSLPAQETEKSDPPKEGKKPRVLPIHPEDAGDVGPVYIDANGTKVRILSQFNDASPVVEVSEDVGARREDIGAKISLKGGKASNYISKKKKKRLAQKHQKYLKLASQRKKVLFREVPGSQISGGREEGNGEGKSCEKDHQMLRQMKPSDCETLRPWVCSKRRGFPKKIAAQESHQLVRCKWHLAQDLLVENDQSSVGVHRSERSCAQKPTILCDDQISSPKNSERMERLFHKDQVNGRRGWSPGRKTVGNLLVGDRISGKVEKLFPPMKRNANQLNKDEISIHDGCCMVRPPNSPRNDVSSLTKKTVYTDDDTSNNFDIYPMASTKSSRSSHAVVTKAMRFSSRKSLPSVRSQSSVTESRDNKMKRWSTLDKSQEPLTREIDEVAVGGHSEADEQYDLMQDHTKNLLEREEMTDEVSLGESPIQEARQEKRFSCTSERLEALNSRSSKSALGCGHVEGINVDYSVRGDGNYVQKVDSVESPGTQVPTHEDIVAEPSSKTLDGRRSVAGMGKSVSTEFHELGISSKVQSNCIRSIEDYGGLLSQNMSTGPTGPFIHDERMFSASEAGNGMMRQDTDMGVGLDSEAVKVDSFPEVDPIPIPGPPGSFLPSPRDMGSEDFQGNSSLTTSRVHSSPDHHDVMDGDSSDSPLSAVSTISNSMVGRSDFNYSEPPSSAGHCVFQDKIRSGLMTARIELLAHNADASPQAATRVERNTFSGEYLKLDRISIEKESFGFKNDQPCCCQRKERFSESVPLNHQESLLQRRWKMASIAVPSEGKQMGCSSNPTPINLDVRPELVPLNSYSASGSEKMVLPLVKPPTDPIPLKHSPSSAGVRMIARADAQSASTSASNPILRLMGKNLMVVNKEDTVPMPIGQVQPCAQNVNQTSHIPTISAVSPGNTQNQDSHSFHHMTPQGSVIFSQDPYKTAVQRLDVVFAESFGSHADSKLSQVPSNLPAGMFCEQRSDGGLAPSMKPHQCKEDYNFSNSQNRLKRRLEAFPTYTMNRGTETPTRLCKRADSSAHPVNEIIDDVPESQAVVMSDITKYNEGWRERQVVPSGISVPTVPIYNMTNVNPFTCYQSQDHPPIGGTPVVHNGSFHASTTRLVNTSPVRWGCPSEGPGALQMNPFVAASNSSGHLRSASLYYSPSF